MAEGDLLDNLQRRWREWTTADDEPQLTAKHAGGAWGIKRTPREAAKVSRYPRPRAIAAVRRLVRR